MDQTAISKSGGKKPSSGCFIVGLVGIGGLLALVILAGVAYSMGYISIPAMTQPTIEPVVTQPATEEVPATEAPVEATTAPEATAAAVVLPPSVEPYDASSGMQYPSIASLADDGGNVSILPNQPTALSIRWCAKNESILSKNTNILNATYTVDGVDLPISSFSVYQTQTMLQISGTKKDFAFCNNLSGLVRNWSEGTHTVSYKLVATKAYNDGWKDHPVDEIVDQGSFTVNVTPSAAAAEWNRCELFEGVKPELVFLEWKPKQPITFYLTFPGGVPGLEKEIAGDTTPWEYSASIGDRASEDFCTYEGYANKLYCKVQIPSDFSNSVQSINVTVNGCSWPIYANPDAEIPPLGK
jgi:hypothetical protein